MFSCQNKVKFSIGIKFKIVLIFVIIYCKSITKQTLSQTAITGFMNNYQIINLLLTWDGLVTEALKGYKMN